MGPEGAPALRCVAHAQARFDTLDGDQHAAAAAVLRELERTLGERPRRLGAFARLALVGALACRAQLEPDRLPVGTALLLSSRLAVWPDLAPQLAAFNVRQQAPTPFDFLAAQCNAACLAVARRLGLSGAALFVAVDDAQRMLAVDALARDAPAVLVGRVEVGTPAWTSEWSCFVRV